MNGQNRRKDSLNDLLFIEEMRGKLRRLNSIQQTTNAMIVRFDLHPMNNFKRKMSNQQRTSFAKKRTLQPLLHRSMVRNSSIDRRRSEIQSLINTDVKSLHPTRLKDYIPIASPTDDEFSSSSSKRTSPKDKYLYEDSHQTNHSTMSPSSPSKNSHDEPPLTSDTLLIGRIYLLNEIYPSLESTNLNGTPLAFLGSEKFLHVRIDWTKVRYPLSPHYIEIILDLILTRPSFIREIPKVTQLNIYRPLIKTISGRLFFDHGEHRAVMHHCHRKLTNYKFTIEDLASIHRREFYIINSNTLREQRFLNLYENLFPIYLSIKPKHSEYNQ